MNPWQEHSRNLGEFTMPTSFSLLLVFAVLFLLLSLFFLLLVFAVLFLLLSLFFLVPVASIYL